MRSIMKFLSVMLASLMLLFVGASIVGCNGSNSTEDPTTPNDDGTKAPIDGSTVGEPIVTDPPAEETTVEPTVTEPSTEEATEAPTVGETDAPAADTTASETTAEIDGCPLEKKGCGATLTALTAVTVILTAAAALKKKED